jgi:hypothetical protein
MADPWEADPIIVPAPQAGSDTSQAPWLADPVTTKAGVPVVPSPTFLESAARGLGLGVRDVLEGSIGPAYDLVGAGINYGAGLAGQPALIAPFSENLTKIGLPEPTSATEKFISGVQRPISGAVTAIGTGGLMSGAASPVVRGVGEVLASQPAGQVVAAGVGGATEQATGSPVAGMAASIATPFVGAGLGAIGREIEHALLSGQITPENARLGQRAIEHYGIPIAANDLSDNSLIRIGTDQSGKLPFSGAATGDKVKQAAWQGAIAREMGEPNATAFTPEVLTRARDRIGAAFDDVATRTRIPPAETATMGRDFNTILPDADLVLGPNDIGKIEKQIKNINSLVAANGGEIPGNLYQTLTHHGGPLARLEGSADPDVAHYAGRIRDALDDAFVRSASPADQEALNQARYQYRVMRTVDNLAAGTRDGGITPLGFMQAVKTASRRFDPATGGMAYTGGGNIGELARIGTLMRPAADSRTTDRALVTGLALGGPAALISHPYSAALAASALPANRMLGNYLRNPETTSRLAESVTSPGAGPRINRLATGMLDASRLSTIAGAENLYQNRMMLRP